MQAEVWLLNELNKISAFFAENKNVITTIGHWGRGCGFFLRHQCCKNTPATAGDHT